MKDSGDTHAERSRAERSQRALLDAASRGSDAALEQLLIEIQAPLLARIRLMMGGAARRVAESGDFLGGLMVDLVESARNNKLPRGSGIVRWATHVARNNIRDAVRKRHHVRLAELSSTVFGVPRQAAEPHADGRAPEEEAALAEQLDLLVDGLENLEDSHREVIELRDLDGLPYGEVAARIGRCSENAARLLHARALTRLSRLCTKDTPR